MRGSRYHVSQMFLLLQPKLLSNSPGVYPSPGHRATRAVARSEKLTDGSGSIGLFFGRLFHNRFTEDGVLS